MGLVFSFFRTKNQHMLGETYDIQSLPENGIYLFTSEGPKGRIRKIVLFQNIGENRFNLAFGDIDTGRIDDAVVSDNLDFVKVLSTVAKCAYDFLEHHPGSILQIRPVDKRRKMLYNAIIRRHYQFLSEQFDVFGEAQGLLEVYSPEKTYEKFELYHII